MTDRIQTFGELTADRQTLAGGKGGTLARLFQAGYPVPDGFVILPTASAGDRLTAEAWTQVQTLLKQMRENGIAFAVRSSALSEDSALASFAGEFETVLDVHSDERVREAIHAVRRSRHSERVQAYSEAHGLEAAHSMAVVVQQLVRAHISGVLFTADPVSGDRSLMLGNFIYGLGDELVSGEAEPYTFTLDRSTGQYEGPRALKRYARQLFRLATRLERDLDCPQDIEWAIAEGRLYLLQSRPITTLVSHDPLTGEWNHTLTGDYVWTSQMTGEIFPRVLTPSTWSVWEILFNRLRAGEIRSTGNIGGRVYMNYSLLYSFLLKFLRDPNKVMGYLEGLGGYAGLPEGMEIPTIPITIRTLLRIVLREGKNELKKRRLQKNRTEFLSGVRERCQQLRVQIKQIDKGRDLIPIWDELEPLFTDVFTLQDATNEASVGRYRSLKQELTELVGPEDTDILLSTLGGGSGQLASLGPLVGLTDVVRGDMPLQAYMTHFGHRGPYENYLSVPRPYEDPNWLKVQLEELEQSPVEIETLLERRRAEFDAVWHRFQERYPGKAEPLERKLDELTGAARAREETRSEVTRIVGVIRALFVRAGELTGLGDDLFFLTYQELLGVLSGDDTPTIHIPARQETYAQYEALPPYPAFIRGRFDPFQWASDPNRRTDIFDARAPAHLPESSLVKGYAGSSGRVEGLVRRIDGHEEGEQLQAGEVLVTSTTNVGWTPLFPRAAAIVTDVGAQLSHAAIVARELGIPAVVGCGDATMRLRTGDRVRVDGGRGTVEILEAA
jgi:phosphohistidine swiveling domain-containing protein